MASQRISLGNSKARRVPPSTSGNTSTVALPRCRRRKARYSPFAVETRSSAETSTPCFAANPIAARPGVRSGLKLADTAGPLISSSRSVCRSGTATRTARRRGVLKVSVCDSGVSRCARSWLPMTSPIWLVRAGSQAAGSSSHPSSRSSSRSTSGHRLRLRLLDVSLRHGHGELSHAQDVGGPFGHADAVAGIEDVEKMRALEAVFESRPDQSRAKQRLGEVMVPLEQVAVKCGKLARRQIDL